MKRKRSDTKFAPTLQNVLNPALVIILIQLVDSFIEAKYSTYRCQEEQPSGTLVADISAGLDRNGEARYSISRSVPNATDMFDLEEASGRLSVGGRLDRERICAQLAVCIIRLDIAVERSGIISDLIQVEISVDDVNDNAPTFRLPLLNKSLPESVPLGLVLEINPAVDFDSPGNGVANYSLEGPSSSPFRLVVDNNRVTNTVGLKLELIRALDRELVDFYQLVVKAVDGGHPPRSGTLLLEIQVEDVNDNSPRFSKDTYEATVASDAPIGTTVVRVTAYDPDLGLNGEERYSLSRKSKVRYEDIFAVNSTSGEVTTKVRLDGVHMSTSYGLVIVAEDLGNNAISTTANLRIQVLSSNHHPPVISLATLDSGGKFSLVEISENSQPHLFIAGLTVTDRDFGPAGQVRCHLNESEFALVSLSEWEFKVVALRSFDREFKDKYIVKVVCFDLGEPSLTSQVEIPVTILDADDNEPRFTQSDYNCTVTEKGPKGMSLVRIQAEDPDLGNNGLVEYMLDSDADRNLFRIDSRSGEIFLMASLDRESIDRFDFGVVAHSGRIETEAKTKTKTENANATFRHQVTCRVHVTVLDENDEPPRFERSTYKFSIGENENSGTEVGRVTARDRDLAPYDAFVYHLEFLPEDTVSASSFAIDPVLGIIYTRQVLDREAASHHTLRVRAKSADVITATDDDVTVVFVQVTDVNDNAPVITFPSGDDDTVHVIGNVTRGQTLANLSAYDRDSGVNSELRYLISAGNDQDTYFLHPKTGRLVWNAEVQADDCVNELEIIVKDGGIPLPLTTSARLYVDFDCEDDLDQRKISSRPDFEDRWRFSFYFITVTVVLVFLILLLLAIVARVGFRPNRVEGLRGRTKDDVPHSRLQGDLLGPVNRGSVDTISGMLIAARAQAVASSSLELDYKRENETNELRRPSQQGNELDESDEGERDTDSGCVDVSTV